MLGLISTAQRNRLIRYGLPVLLVALVFGLQLLLRPERATSPPLFLFLGVVLASNWYGGLTAGLISVALSALAAGTIMQPLLTERAASWRAIIEILVFVLEGLVICWMIQTLRTNEQTVVASTQKQEELRRRFRATFEQAAVGLAHVDLDGRWLRVNQKLCEIVGYSSQELMQLTFQDITYADDLAADLELAQQLLAGDIPCYSLQKRYIHKDGSLIWINLTASLVRDSSNQPQYFIAVVEDICAAKRGEAERLELLLREQQARAEAEIQRSRLQMLLEEAPVLIAVSRGPNHVFEFANPLYRQVVGNRDLIGLSTRESLPELADQGFFEILDQVFRTGEPFVGNEFPARIAQAEGKLQERFFNFVYQPLRGLNEDIEGILTFAYEVTDQVLARQQVEALARALRRQQQALRESEERYRSLVEATAQIIWDTKAEGEFVTPQPGWSSFTGQTTAELWGWGWLNAVHPDDREPTAKAWSAAVANRSLHQVEHRLRRHDGEYRYMSVRAVPVLTPDGQVREWIGVHTDITDRKQAEADRDRLLERAQQARAEAEAANRTKDEFLATLSHELRTPLNAILGWTQLLQKGNLEPHTIVRALETIERNARMQSQLIEDILDVSRIITGKLRLEIKMVDLAAVIGAAVDSVRLAAQTKEIDLRLDLERLTEPISGDANRLQQVVWNLLSNAIKFTPKGGQVQVCLERVDADVQIRVQDNGRGIHPHFLPHIFERFRQADGSSTRSHGGLGLGLAIVRHLVELHGGQIQAQSRGEGQGATFIVTLPLQVGKPVLASGQLPHDPPLLAAAPREQLLEGIWVVVVDDEADARELVAMVLEEQGAVVTLAASAAEALAVFAQAGTSASGLSRLPDLLVSDIAMPGEDGYALIQNLRTLAPEAGGKVAAIALTAYARDEERLQALAAGFQAHLAKPVLPDILVAKIAELTGGLEASRVE